MSEKVTKMLKKLFAAIARLFRDGIAELHISGGIVAFKVDLNRLATTA